MHVLKDIIKSGANIIRINAKYQPIGKYNELREKILKAGKVKILIDIKNLGHKIGIFTSNSTENVTEFLKKHNLDFFDFISSSKSVWGKNFGLNKLINKEGFLPEKVFYIGDETRDIEAARKSE